MIFGFVREGKCCLFYLCYCGPTFAKCLQVKIMNVCMLTLLSPTDSFLFGRTTCSVETLVPPPMSSIMFKRKTLNIYQLKGDCSARSNLSLSCKFHITCATHYVTCSFQNDQQFPCCISASPVACWNRIVIDQKTKQRPVFFTSVQMYLSVILK